MPQGVVTVVTVHAMSESIMEAESGNLVKLYAVPTLVPLLVRPRYFEQLSFICRRAAI